MYACDEATAAVALLLLILSVASAAFLIHPAHGAHGNSTYTAQTTVPSGALNASNWINLAQQLVAAVKAASPSTKVDVAAA